MLSSGKVQVEKEALYIGLLAFLLFTLGVDGNPFIDFESRFALFAREMWRHGPSLFPTTYGEPYPDYPVTSTLLIWLCAHLFGGVTRLAAVLPTAFASAMTVTLSYRLLTPFSRRWAFATICLEIMTLNFLAEARSISLDQMIAAITIASFYLAFTGNQRKHVADMTGLLLLFVAGFAIRGPLGVVIPAAVAASCYLLSAQWKKLLLSAALAAAVIVICWCAMIALATHVYGSAFAQDVIRMQVSGRIELTDKLSPLYYFTSSIGNYAPGYPLALLSLTIIFLSQHKRLRLPLAQDASSLLFYLAAWAVVVLAGLSVPDTKKVRYVLPMVPAICALAAYPFHDDSSRPWHRAWQTLAIFLSMIFLAFPSLALLAVWKLPDYAVKHGMTAPPALNQLALLFAVLQAVMLTLYWRLAANIKHVIPLAGAALTLWMLTVAIVEPVTINLHEAQPRPRQLVSRLHDLSQPRARERRHRLAGLRLPEALHGGGDPRRGGQAVLARPPA